MMATTKPRVTVTLTPRQHEVFRSLSENSGQSISSLIGEIIELSMPTFERMAATFQRIRESQMIERERVSQALADAQSALEPIALEAVGQFDLFLGRVESAAGVGPERSEDTAPAARPAPVTNRGATPGGRKRAAPSAATESSDSKKKSFKKTSAC